METKQTKTKPRKVKPRQKYVEVEPIYKPSAIKRVEIIFNSQVETLRSMINRMSWLGSKGFEPWVEGLGDGTVKVAFERR